MAIQDRDNDGYQDKSVQTNGGACSLTLEQQFKLKVLTEQTQRLTPDEAKTYLIEMFRQTMIKDNIYKQMLKSEGFFSR